tara:strand:+ start:133 stop:1005 length:873 start_codon:yes stop_codon:yes gene_type:complete
MIYLRREEAVNLKSKMSTAQTIFLLLRYFAKLYRATQEKFPNIFPADPLNVMNKPKSPLTKFLLRLKIYAHTSDFEPIIKKELLFFVKNQKELDARVSAKKLGIILSLIRKTEEINGDIIELGVASGGTTVMMAHFLKQINSKRKIYAYDTFEGYPYEDKFSVNADDESKKLKGDDSFSLDFVRNKIKKFNMHDKITLVKGPFEDTLHLEATPKQFSFIFSDSGLYDSTKFSLDFVWVRLSKNGIILFDQYGGGTSDQLKGGVGETKAVDEFCAKEKLNLQLNPEPMLIK